MSFWFDLSFVTLPIPHINSQQELIVEISFLTFTSNVVKFAHALLFSARVDHALIFVDLPSIAVDRSILCMYIHVVNAVEYVLH